MDSRVRRSLDLQDTKDRCAVATLKDVDTHKYFNKTIISLKIFKTDGHQVESLARKYSQMV